MIIYKAGSGLDNQSTSQGYTTEELASSAIEEDIVNSSGEYTVELVKDSTNHILRLIMIGMENIQLCHTMDGEQVVKMSSMVSMP